MPAVGREPAWLTAAVDQRLAMLKDFAPAALVKGYDATMLLLTEPEDDWSKDQTEEWETSCDNCGKPHPKDIWTGHVFRMLHGRQVVIVFGACPECMRRK